MVNVVVFDGVGRRGDGRAKNQGWGKLSAPRGGCGGDEVGPADGGLLVVIAGGRALSATRGKACPSGGGGGGCGTLATRWSFRRSCLRERERRGGVITRDGNGISWRRIGLRVERGAEIMGMISFGGAHFDGRSWRQEEDLHPERSTESTDDVGGRLRAAVASRNELGLVCLAPLVPLRSGGCSG